MSQHAQSFRCSRKMRQVLAISGFALLLVLLAPVSQLGAAEPASPRNTAVVVAQQTAPPSPQMSPVPETPALLNDAGSTPAKSEVNYLLLFVVMVVLHSPILIGIILALRLLFQSIADQYSVLADRAVPNDLSPTAHRAVK